MIKLGKKVRNEDRSETKVEVHVDIDAADRDGEWDVVACFLKNGRVLSKWNHYSNPFTLEGAEAVERDVVQQFKSLGFRLL